MVDRKVLDVILMGGSAKPSGVDMTTATVQALASVMSVSRAGNAVYHDGTAFTYAPNQTCTYNDDFANAAWSLTGSTRSGNTITASAGAGYHSITGAAGSVDPGMYYIVAFEVSAGAARYVTFGNGNDSGWHMASYDFQTGSISVTLNVANSGSVTLANGNTLVWIKATNIGTSGAVQPFCAPNPSGSSLHTYTADGTETVNVFACYVSRVGYETAPRPADLVKVGASAYYGPRLTHKYNASSARWERAGLMVEDTAQNIVLHALDFSKAAWDKALYPCSVAASATLSSDAISYLQTVTATAGLGRHAVSQSVGVSASKSYALRAEVKKGTARYVAVGDTGDAVYHTALFDLDTLSWVFVENVTGLGYEDLGGGIYKIACRLTRTNAGTANVVVGPYPTNNASSFAQWTAAGTETVLVTAVQMEELDGASSSDSSFIPTYASAVTRAPEIVTIVGRAAAKMASGVWTAIVETTDVKMKTAYNAVLVGSSVSGLIPLYASTTSASGSAPVNSYANAAAISTAGISYVATLRSGLATSPARRTIAANGGSDVSDSNAINSSGTFYIGYGGYTGSNYLNGIVRRFKVYNRVKSPRSLTDASAPW